MLPVQAWTPNTYQNTKWTKTIIFTFLVNVKGDCESEHEMEQNNNIYMIFFTFNTNLTNENVNLVKTIIFILILNIFTSCTRLNIQHLSEYEMDQNNNIYISCEHPRRMRISTWMDLNNNIYMLVALCTSSTTLNMKWTKTLIFTCPLYIQH